MSSVAKSKYGVFIIESLDLEDEKSARMDGYILSQMLDLCEIDNQYYYIRTKLELEKIIELFEESEYAFLHLSCHANDTHLHFTFDAIDFKEFGLIIGTKLRHRRLFLSACKAAQFELAREFIPKVHCYSVIGSPDNIEFDKSAVFWSSFYYLMYDANTIGMPQRDLKPILTKTSLLFKLKLRYFSIISAKRDKKSIDHLHEFLYDNGELQSWKKRETGYKNQFRL